MHDFGSLETDFLTPSVKVTSAVIKCLTKFDKHIERHHQSESIFASCIVDQGFDDDESAAVGQVRSGLNSLIKYYIDRLRHFIRSGEQF